MPEISLITSCYKATRFLEEYLNSLAEQSFKGFELVLHMNEMSSDEKEVINSYSKRLNIVLIEENPVIPLYSAWNKCIQKSSGNYIGIGNVDDLRSPDSLKYMFEAFKQNKNLDFVYGDFTTVHSFPSKNGERVDIFSQQDKLKIGMILGPFFMFKRSILEKTGLFDEQFKSGGDFDFAMRLVRSGNGRCLKENLGFYLDEGKGLSTGNQLQPIEKTVILLRYGLQLQEKKWLNKALKYSLNSMKWGGASHLVSDFFVRNSLPVLNYQEKSKEIQSKMSYKLREIFDSLLGEAK